MNFADRAFQRTWRRLVLTQVILLLVAALVSFPLKSNEFVVALLFGGAISIVSTLISVWRTKVATDTAAENAAMSMLELYKSFFIRLVVVMTLMIVGFKWLALTPAALILGFIVAQLGFLLARPVGTAKRRIG